MRRAEAEARWAAQDAAARRRQWIRAVLQGGAALVAGLAGPYLLRPAWGGSLAVLLAHPTLVLPPLVTTIGILVCVRQAAEAAGADIAAGWTAAALAVGFLGPMLLRVV